MLRCARSARTQQPRDCTAVCACWHERARRPGTMFKSAKDSYGQIRRTSVFLSANSFLVLRQFIIVQTYMVNGNVVAYCTQHNKFTCSPEQSQKNMLRCSQFKDMANSWVLLDCNLSRCIHRSILCRRWSGLKWPGQVMSCCLPSLFSSPPWTGPSHLPCRSMAG
jgi:hypothetical protein